MYNRKQQEVIMKCKYLSLCHGILITDNDLIEKTEFDGLLLYVSNDINCKQANQASKTFIIIIDVITVYCPFQVYGQLPLP
jgi:hypothetical protein